MPFLGDTEVLVEQQESFAMVVESDLIWDPPSIEVLVYVPRVA